MHGKFMEYSTSVGAHVVSPVGECDGVELGICEPSTVGFCEGPRLGAGDSSTVGSSEGNELGCSDSSVVGGWEGSELGAKDSSTVGLMIHSLVCSLHVTILSLAALHCSYIYFFCS